MALQTAHATGLPAVFLYAELAGLCALCALSGYVVMYLRSVNHYSKLSTAWQLTMCSLHAGPAIVLRLVLPPQAALAGCAAWAGASWAMRRCSRRIGNLPSAGLVLVEGLATMIPLTRPLLGGVLFLQGLIVVVYWSGCFAVSCSDSISLSPMDRLLRRGLRHILTSREAQREILHEFLVHGLPQALLARLILAGDATLWRLDLGHVRSAAALVATYLVVVFVTVAVFPPHKFPYFECNVRAILAAKMQDWKLYLTFIGASTFWAPTFVAGVVSVLRAFSQASTSDAAACEGGEVWSSMVAAAAGIFGVLGAAFHKFMLQQRLGDTATCLVGAAVAAPASTLLGFTQHAWQTFLGGCVHGIGLGMASSFSPISTAYCQRAHPDSFAAAIAFFDAGQLVGLTAGPLLVGLSLGTGTACELEPYRLQALSTGSGICYLLFMATCIVLSAASAEAPRAPEVPLPGGVPQQPPQEGPQPADAASIGNPMDAADPADV